MEALSLGYPFGEELAVSSGKIKKIDGYEFEHNIPTEQGSSGSPVFLFNLLSVIGIHKYGDRAKKINIGIFIGEIFDEIKDDLSEKNNEKNIKVKEDDKRNIERIDKNNILDLSHKHLGNERLQQRLNLINDNIIELNLSWNNISDIKILEKVKFNKLEKLDLGWNKISNNINILENVNFKELKELNLYHNNISDIKVLEKVKFNKLEKLNLRVNNISNISSIISKLKFKKFIWY